MGVMYRLVIGGAAGDEALHKHFSPPLEKCVGHTVVKTIGHSLKNLGPSQKTLLPIWCPKLFAGLDM